MRSSSCRSGIAHGFELMDLDWLEDFSALAEHGNFSRAAAARHVTQPAFSRRIRALEDWIGVALFIRDSHGVSLTAAGETFRHGAEETARRILQLRTDSREAAGKEAATLRFAATHALSFTFFPAWIRGLDPDATVGIRLMSDHMQACEQLMLQGRAQFLLCHHHAAVPDGFPAGQFRSIVVGTDALIPLCAPDRDGAPRWRLPGASGAPVRLLSYSAESGLGRIVAARQAKGGLCGEAVFTSHLAAALLSMARDRNGVAWLPASLAEPDLGGGRLVRAGDTGWDIALEIRLFRPRARLSRAAEVLWSRVVR
jgi:DNA-binding transcriptional LysR family regulator